ncbi:MAG TPA: lipid-binding SYLF domain-containing protein, partial [Acidobacteriota bacterium]|nr:lipid-binding SYLF domain-containing protein [Acidobacteriota bacterium]
KVTVTITENSGTEKYDGTEKKVTGYTVAISNPLYTEADFTFSGDAAATAGPVGRNAEAGTDLTLRAGILSYSRSKGLFAGISIQGATLTIDRKANYTFYQKLIDHRKILSDALMPVPEEFQGFLRLLQPYLNQ